MLEISRNLGFVELRPRGHEILKLPEALRACEKNKCIDKIYACRPNEKRFQRDGKEGDPNFPRKLLDNLLYASHGSCPALPETTNLKILVASGNI